MENQIKMNATVVSQKGLLNLENEENFFLNGRFRYEFESDNIQVSIHNMEDNFHTLAICEGMDKEKGENRSFISMIRELKRFHDKIKANPKTIESVQNDLVERVKEISNLVHSVSLENSELLNGKIAFSGIVIMNGKASVVNLGGSKVYLFRDGNVKGITNERKKAERLIKMGIISSEQADRISKDYFDSEDAEFSNVQLFPLDEIKENDVFLFCSEILANSIDEDIINEILSVKGEPEYIANTLLKEAHKSIDSESMSVLVAKIEKSQINEMKVQDFVKKAPVAVKKTPVIESYDEEDQENSKIGTIIAAVLTCVVLIAIGFSIYYFVFRDKDTSSSKPVPSETRSSITVAETVYTPEPTSIAPSDSSKDTKKPGIIKDGTKYVVKAGDSLAKISKMFYGDTSKIKNIMDANNIKDANHISVGQVLIIPKVGDLKPKVPTSTYAP